MTCHILAFDGFQSPCDFDEGLTVWQFVIQFDIWWHFDSLFDMIQDFGFEAVPTIHMFTTHGIFMDTWFYRIQYFHASRHFFLSASFSDNFFMCRYLRVVLQTEMFTFKSLDFIRVIFISCRGQMILLHLCLAYLGLSGIFKIWDVFNMNPTQFSSWFALISFGLTLVNTYNLSTSFVAEWVFKT